MTGLSPYLTHGLLTLREVLAGVLQRELLPVQHKLVFELGWREYFRHAWAHAGDGILRSLHPGALSGAARVRSVDDPHVTRWLERVAQLDPAPALFPAVERHCDSFSQWWTRATRRLQRAEELL